jgi:acyl-coenzyme A synthetase/AMP-(fatty) acid ligase
MVIEKIFQQARLAPEKIALYYGLRPISYAAFAAWIAYAREFLKATNLPAEGVAVLDTVSLLDAWVLGFALRSLGLTTVAVRSLDQLADLALPRSGCIVTAISDRPLQIPASLDNFKLLRIEPHSYMGVAAGELPDLPRGTPVGGHILLTSGTTGTSKKVLVADAHLADALARRAAVYELPENPVVNVFNYGQWTGVGYKLPSCVWSMGGTVVIYQGDDPHRSLDIPRLTHAIFNTTTLSNMLKAPPGELRRRDTMRIVFGAGPLPHALAVEAKAKLTPNLYTCIASTETGTWTMTRIDGQDDLRLHRVHPSIDVRVVDAQGRPLPPGESGEIRIATVDGVTGYLGDAEATRIFFRDGYFHSGDLGVFHADGRLELLGRITNVINIDGGKVAVEPIEAALQNRLDADAVCVFATPNAAGTEELHVAIESRRKIAQATLAPALQAELKGYPHARVHFVSAIPRNAPAKIDRAALKRLLFKSPS